jgi:hypothetical protein
VTGRLEFSQKLILDLLRRRTWLIAVAITLVSFLLGAAHWGPGSWPPCRSSFWSCR